MAMTKKLIVFAVALAMLGIAAPAFGQSASQGPYSTNAPLAQEEVDQGNVPTSNNGLGPSGADQGGGAPKAAAAGTGAANGAGEGASLPFTGTDLILLLAAGAVFLSLGLTLRRLTRNPDLA